MKNIFLIQRPAAASGGKLAAALVFALMLFAVSTFSPPQASAAVNIGPDKIKTFYYFQWWAKLRNTGSGPNGTDETYDTFFRRNRLGFFGDVNDTLGFYLQFQGLENTPDRRVTPTGVSGEGGSETFNIIDAYLTFYLDDSYQLIVGKFKNAFSRSNLEGCAIPITLDRSPYVYEPYRVSRDFGYALWGNLWDAKVGYKLAIMEGRDGRRGNNIESGGKAYTQFRYEGRVHLSLMGPEFMYGYGGTYMGSRQVLTFGAGYSYEPSVVYADMGDPAAGIAPSSTKDYSAMTVDAFFEYPYSFATVTLSAAAFNFSWDDAYKGARPDTSSYGYRGERSGYYAKGAYMPVWKLGPGKIQAFVRYERWRFAWLGPVYDQVLTVNEFGFNYYLYNDVLKITLDYSSNVFDVEEVGPSPTYANYDTYTLGIQMHY